MCVLFFLTTAICITITMFNFLNGQNAAHSNSVSFIFCRETSKDEFAPVLHGVMAAIKALLFSLSLFRTRLVSLPRSQKVQASLP